MKEKILNLREEGKTYNEIKSILGCSKGTISYHCGDNQKEKTKKRTQKRRENTLLAKTDRFKYRKKRKNKIENLRKFQKTEYVNNIRQINTNLNGSYTWKDILDLHGEDITCYLSGEKMNIYDKNCSFDHIIPVSKGGDNSLNNLGLTHIEVNEMKKDCTPEELINWCVKILEHNNYKIEKKDKQ